MRKIGIIGGLGPEATVDYYKRITTFFHHYNQSLATPEIIIYSIDLADSSSWSRSNNGNLSLPC